MRVERFGPSVSRFDSFEGPMGSFLCDAWHSRHNLGTKYFRQSLTQKKRDTSEDTPATCGSLAKRAGLSNLPSRPRGWLSVIRVLGDPLLLNSHPAAHIVVRRQGPLETCRRFA